MILVWGDGLCYIHCHVLPRGECTVKLQELEVNNNDWEIKPLSLTSIKLKVTYNMD